MRLEMMNSPTPIKHHAIDGAVFHYESDAKRHTAELLGKTEPCPCCTKTGMVQVTTEYFQSIEHNPHHYPITETRRSVTCSYCGGYGYLRPLPPLFQKAT